MFTQILVPLDGSEYGERALRYATELAAIAGAHVSLLAVVVSVDSPLAAASTESTEHRRQLWITYLEEKAQTLREVGSTDVTVHVRFGEPAGTIVELAKEEQTDLIVMSTEGVGADGRFTLGSVALKVLMTAPCPVFMVRINRPEPPRTLAEERWQGEGGANVG